MSGGGALVGIACSWARGQAGVLLNAGTSSPLTLGKQVRWTCVGNEPLLTMVFLYFNLFTYFFNGFPFSCGQPCPGPERMHQRLSSVVPEREDGGRLRGREALPADRLEQADSGERP